MPNQFCRHLSNGYSFNIDKNNDVNVIPCCWYRDDGIPLNQNLLENRLKKFNTVTDWTPKCQVCYDLEQAGHLSLRQGSVNWVDDNEWSNDPVTVDIHLDHECNAACMICNEDSSSLWLKEKQKLKNQPVKFYSNPTTIDQAIEKIVTTVSLEKVKYVKFFGGEPLFTDTHLKFLQHIPNPDQVTVHYTTNASIYPNEQTQKIWKKFKTIIYAASVDGVEEQFDYIRWPLAWDKVSNNLLRIKNNPDIWNVMFKIEFTVNFLNAYYFDRVEKWVQENLPANSGGDETKIDLHPCFGLWDLNKMPLGVRNLILAKYSTTHVVHKMISNLPQQPQPMGPWYNFVDTWDSRRKNSWKTAFPDLVEFI